jgi:hypothetical protein
VKEVQVIVARLKFRRPRARKLDEARLANKQTSLNGSSLVWPA